MPDQAVAEHNRLRPVRKMADVNHNLWVLIRAITTIPTLPEEIDEESNLRQDLGLKGDKLRDFFVRIEQYFDCTFSPETRKRLETVGGLSREICRNITRSRRIPPS